LERGHEAAVQANPFFNMVPTWGVIPLVIVATCATIIASQAVISGAFSLTWQAIQLDYLPRFKVMHTSSEDRGQIYIPIINWLLFAACVMLVVMFKTSGSLAAAYGIAVTSTMVITTILAWFAIRNILGWNTWVAGAVCSAFLIIDGSFLAANALKFPDGGWVPVAMAALIFMVMITWNTGHRLLGAAIARRGRPLVDVLREENRWIETVAGSSVYMTRDLVNAPQALITNLRMNRVRHETIILVWINVEKQARLVHKRDAEKPFVVKSFEEINAHTVEIKYGFMEQVNLERDLKLFPMQGVPVDVTDAVFVLGHENVSVQSNKGMALWRKKLFVFLHRNSRMPAGYFGIADKHTLEIGAKVTI
jgi:KUP system potassium uptake protein